MASWCALAASPASAGVVSPEYEEALHLYARGERLAALAALSRLSADHLDQQVHALQNAARQAAHCPSCVDPLRDMPLKAAVMLHADRDESDRPQPTGREHPPVCPGDQARRAGQIAALLAPRDPDSDFSRRFFLAMAQRCQWAFCLEAATQWGRDGLQRFPRDPALLLTIGATLEEEATLARFPGRTASGTRTPTLPLEAMRARQRLFLDAQRFLADAVAADQTLMEARVRLGRVQFWLGQDEVARATLEEALRRGGPAPFPYLGHLFLGQVKERAGRADDAIREFTRARALDPESQAAGVALSQALFATGEVEKARHVLEQTLAHAGRRTARDAQWDYVAGDAARGPDIFEALREATLE